LGLLCAIASETALARLWDTQEEDEYWFYLAEDLETVDGG
jgi:hypothetical protein